MDNMETRLRDLLETFTYRSSVYEIDRPLQKHHIDALMKVLVPFIERESSKDTTEYCKFMGYEH